MTQAPTPATPNTDYVFTFDAARTACRDILDALTSAGFEPWIDYLAGGCAAIRILLRDGSAVLISDNDARLPLSDAPRKPWLALHYPGRWNGYPADEDPITVHNTAADGATDDTAAMLAAVTAYTHSL